MEAPSLVAATESIREAESFVYSETGLFFTDPDTAFLKDRTIRFGNLIGLFTFHPLTFEVFLSHPYQNDSILAKHRMLVADGHKLIYIPTRQGARFECYDLTNDPEEVRNIFSPDHAVCASLKQRLLAFMVEKGDGRRIADYVVPR